MRQRYPTGIQKVMIALLGVAALSIGMFALPEIAGIFSPELEDTFSEWVWDLPLVAVLVISSVFASVGAIAIWAAGHFLEGWQRRKDDQD